MKLRETKAFKSIYIAFNTAVIIAFVALVVAAWPYEEQHGYSQREIDAVGSLAVGETAKPVALWTEEQIGDARIYAKLYEKD